MSGSTEIPQKSGDLRPFKDRVWIYLGEERGWRPQLSVQNCNKNIVWELLTASPQNLTHRLERGGSFYSFSEGAFTEVEDQYP